MSSKKTAAAPSTARDTVDIINSTMKDTSQNSGTPTNSKTATEFDEVYAKASGPASAKLKK